MKNKFFKLSILNIFILNIINAEYFYKLNNKTVENLIANSNKTESCQKIDNIQNGFYTNICEAKDTIYENENIIYLNGVFFAVKKVKALDSFSCKSSWWLADNNLNQYASHDEAIQISSFLNNEFVYTPYKTEPYIAGRSAQYALGKVFSVNSNLEEKNIQVFNSYIRYENTLSNPRYPIPGTTTSLRQFKNHSAGSPWYQQNPNDPTTNEEWRACRINF